MEFSRLLLGVLLLESGDGAKTTPKSMFCQEQSVLLGSEANMAKVVDAQLFTFISLLCNFCNEKGDHSPKIWNFKKRGTLDKPSQVTIDVNTAPADNRISITPVHTLIISNFSYEDSGIYSCQPINAQSESIFTYYLDAVSSGFTLPKTGRLSQWKEYKRNKLDSINEKFDKSNDPAFRYLRENFNFTFRLVTVWEPWGPCEACGRLRGHAIKRKEGKCRLHPLLSSRMLPPSNDSFVLDMTTFYLVHDYDVSCRSLKLHEDFSDLSKIVRNVPEFSETASCPAVCGSGSADQPILQIKNVIRSRDARLTIFTTGTSVAYKWSIGLGEIRWGNVDAGFTQDIAERRNNMAEGEEEPNLTIDSFNSLYILHATKGEGGVFSCTVDGEKMQVFTVDVVSKSKIQSQEFLRYSMYLGFVLTLSLTCYCTGLCVAWRRRCSFADPLNLCVRDEALGATGDGSDRVRGKSEAEEPLLY